MNNSIPSLKEYLTMMGVSPNTPAEQIDFHKKQHRKMYQKAYGEARRRRVVRVEHTLSKAEYRKLKRFAGRYKRRALNRFILDCAIAYLENEYVNHDEELTKGVMYQIRAIGNNVNQVVHQLHRTKDYQNKVAYQQLKKQIDALYQTVQTYMKQPPKIKPILEKLFEEVPESIDDFEQFLASMRSKNEADDYQNKE